MERAVITVEEWHRSRNHWKHPILLQHCVLSEYYWGVNGWSPPPPSPSPCTSSQFYGVQKLSAVPLPWELHTWNHNKRHCFIMFGCIHSQIFLFLQNFFMAFLFFFFLPGVFSLSLRPLIQKLPAQHSLFFFFFFYIMVLCSLISEWVWACFLLRIPVCFFTKPLHFYRNWGHSSWLEVPISAGLFLNECVCVWGVCVGHKVCVEGAEQGGGVAGRSTLSSIDKGETDIADTLWLAGPLVNLVTQHSRHQTSKNIALLEFSPLKGLMIIRSRIQTSVCVCAAHNKYKNNSSDVHVQLCPSVQLQHRDLNL